MRESTYDLSPDVFRRREHHGVFTRMRAEDPVQQLITRMSKLELAGEVEMLRSNFVGGITSMPVRWQVG